MIWLIIIIFIFILLLLYHFNLIVPKTKGLPVLLYHKLSSGKSDELTVSLSEFKKQMEYLKSNSYSTVSISDLINYTNSKIPLPVKPVLITFDDGYLNNYELAFPVLKELNFKASIFLATQFIGKSNLWDDGKEKIISPEEINLMGNDCIEFALHSHSHLNFENESASEIENEISQSINTLRSFNINFVYAFAYPYGKRPHTKSIYDKMIDVFKQYNINIAFRIGNRVNRLPLKNIFEIKRISISGFDTLNDFKVKLNKGRLKQF